MLDCSSSSLRRHRRHARPGIVSRKAKEIRCRKICHTPLEYRQVSGTCERAEGGGFRSFTYRFGSFGEDRSCSQGERSEWNKRRAASSRRLDSPRRSIGHPIATRYVAAYRFRCLIAAVITLVDDNASASGASCIRNVSAGVCRRCVARSLLWDFAASDRKQYRDNRFRSVAISCECSRVRGDRSSSERERARFFESFSFELQVSNHGSERARDAVISSMIGICVGRYAHAITNR